MATAKQTKFIEDIYKYVAKYAPQYNVKCYSAVIAQAICESAWGESVLSAKYHNYFGLKCGTLWKGGSVNMRTGEEYNGKHVTISDNFRTYSSMEEGVKGYFVFLFDGRTRYNNLKGVTDPKTYLQNIKNDGYATSSNYVNTNVNIVNQFNLTKYDPVSKPVKTEVSDRQAVINVFESWLGKKESDGSHKEIIDIYNKYLSTAVKFGTLNYRVSYSDSWCATAVSSAFIHAGLASLCPIECSCPSQIALAKKMGIWIEKDSTVPEPGWIVEYDWQDSTGSGGDNLGTADHVGLVVSVNKSAGTFKVIEGNKNDAVGSFGSIKCSAVAQHGDLLDVSRIDVRQHIVVEALVQHGTRVLLIDDDAVDDDKRLGVDVQRVKTLHKHHRTHAGRAAATDGVHVGAHLVLHLILDVNGVGVAEVGCLPHIHHIGLCCIVAAEGGDIEH